MPSCKVVVGIFNFSATLLVNSDGVGPSSNSFLSISIAILQTSTKPSVGFSGVLLSALVVVSFLVVGSVAGSVIGSVIGSVTGSVTGSATGSVAGSFTGSATGSVTGSPLVQLLVQLPVQLPVQLH